MTLRANWETLLNKGHSTEGVEWSNVRSVSMRNSYAMLRRFDVVLVALTLLRFSSSAPLQWEQIQAVGIGPGARYSHAVATFDTAQDTVFLYGGTNHGDVYEDMWWFDTAVNGWEGVQFEQNVGVLCQPDLQINTVVPGLPDYAADNVTGSIDCWWFTPRPIARWDVMKLAPRSPKPVPREGHSMQYDKINGHMIMFGGLDSTNHALQECFYVTVASGLEVWTGDFEWKECPHNASTGLAPSGRYGHGSVFFEATQAMYIYGGFESSSGVVYAAEDMWRLFDYHINPYWEQVMSVSSKPAARGFHATWITGISLIIHGGQGESGLGVASVLSDTWSFDLYTGVWLRFSLSDAVPTASHLAVLSVNENLAVSFGGKGQTGLALGSLFTFVPATGWQRVLPAGGRPSPRTGHAAVHDQASYTMVIFGGMELSTDLSEEIWTLDMQSKTWHCERGRQHFCTHAPQVFPVGPGPLTFHAGTGVGLFMFVFGGISGTQCKADFSGAMAALPLASSDMWALNLASYEWSKVIPPLGDDGNPGPRAMSALASPGQVPGLNNLLGLIGGASMACFDWSPPCEYPQPMNDMWVIDAAPAETFPPQPLPSGEFRSPEQMAFFDGVDDIIAVQLPAWCSQVESMSVLWIDAWMSPSTRGEAKSILMDAYSGHNSVLRWYFEGIGTEIFASLVLFPDGASTLVKRWGPLDHNILGFWHHITFTARFARVFSSASTSPQVVLTQAHMFVDGAAPHIASNAFLTVDIATVLAIKSGLSKVFIGGNDPSSTAPGYRSFAGSMDNVRLWWPPCPGKDDPTRCNPYGFLYPKLKDGTRRPTSGIEDHQVQMQHVAARVRDAMFLEEVPWSRNDTEDSLGWGLLVDLNFNDTPEQGSVRDASTWPHPSLCSADLTDQHCPGCEPSCVYGACDLFSTQCVSRGISLTESLRTYGEEGLCQCRNVDDCPREVAACQCPGSMHRVCARCQVEVLYLETGHWSFFIGEIPGYTVRLDAAYCPDEMCQEWECLCYNKRTGEGLLGSDPIVDQVEGTAECPYECPGDLEVADDRVEKFSVVAGPPGRRSEPQVEVSIEHQCCGDYWDDKQVVCLEWTYSFNEEIAAIAPQCLNFTFYSRDGVGCGVDVCCGEASDGDADVPDVGGPPGGEDAGGGEDVGAPVYCTVEYHGDEAILTCYIVQDSGSWEGFFEEVQTNQVPAARRMLALSPKIGESAEPTPPTHRGKLRHWTRRHNRRLLDGHEAVDGVAGESNEGDGQAVVAQTTTASACACACTSAAQAQTTAAAQEGGDEQPPVQARRLLNDPPQEITEANQQQQQQTTQSNQQQQQTTQSNQQQQQTTQSNQQQQQTTQSNQQQQQTTQSNQQQQQTTQSNQQQQQTTQSNQLSHITTAASNSDGTPSPDTSSSSASACDCACDDTSGSDDQSGQTDGAEQEQTTAAADSQNGGAGATSTASVPETTATDGGDAPPDDGGGTVSCSEVSPQEVEMLWDSYVTIASTMDITVDNWEDKYTTAIVNWANQQNGLQCQGVIVDQGCFDSCSVQLDYVDTTIPVDGGAPPFRRSNTDRARPFRSARRLHSTTTVTSYVQAAPHTVEALSGAAALTALETQMQQTLGNDAPSIEEVASFGAVCGDGVVDRGEQCDLGPGLNNDYSSCAATCQCNLDKGFNHTQDTCTCTAEVDFEVSVAEENRLQSRDNEITVNFFFRSGIDGTESNKPSPKYAVVTISGLQGSLTADAELDVMCRGGQPCDQIGLQPQNPAGNQVNWRTGKGQWVQSEGTLTFTVLRDQTNNNKACSDDLTVACDFLQSASLDVSFVIQNRAEAQTAIHPVVHICAFHQLYVLGNWFDFTWPVLASNEVDMTGLSQDMDKYLQEQDSVQTAATVTLEAAANIRLTLAEAVSSQDIDDLFEGFDVDVRAVTAEQILRLPQGAQFAGIGTSFLNIDLKNVAAIAGQVSMGVDGSIIQTHGGCYLPEDRRIRVCLSGWAGLYRFDSASRTWEAQTGVTVDSKHVESVDAQAAITDSLSDWAVLATQPCCDYEGQGRACGDAVCILDLAPQSEEELEELVSVPGFLGDLTVSKMPSVRGSTRPALSSLSDLQAYLQTPTSTSPTYDTRSSWSRVIPASTLAVDCLGYRTNAIGWLPERFDHAVEAASNTRFLVYGGVGCNKYETRTVPNFNGIMSSCQVCTELKILDDLWEFDVLKVNSSDSPFTLLEVSPALTGLVGSTSVNLPNSDHRILAFGGSSHWFLLDLLLGLNTTTTDEMFEYRDYQFRSRTANRESIAGVSCLSSHSEVANSTLVILFGGFVRNMLTSAVYTFDLSSATPSLGLARFGVLAEGPRARVFPGIVKPNDVLLLMFGGTEGGLEGLNHEGNSQLWELDLTTQAWSLLHGSGSATVPDKAAFFAFTSIDTGDDVLLLMHGGLREGFHPTISFTFQETDSDDYQPTSNIRVWFFSTYGTESSDFWWSVYSKQGVVEEECCDPGGDIPSYCGDKPVMGCEQPGAAMHTVTVGAFSAGQMATMVYGGVGRFGDALDSLWYVDTNEPDFAFSLSMAFSDITPAQFASELGEFRALLETAFTFDAMVDCDPLPTVGNWRGYLCGASSWGQSCDRNLGKQVYNIVAEEQGGVTRVTMAASVLSYYLCVAPLFSAPQIWDRAKLTISNTSALSTATFLPEVIPELDDFSVPSAILLQWWQYNQNDGCRTGCMRGLCQGTEYAVDDQDFLYPVQGFPEMNDKGEAVYCYAAVECGVDYTCALPGPRHGHASTSFLLAGSSEILLHFGGEKTGVYDEFSELTRDLHLGYFSLTGVVFSTPVVSDIYGGECWAFDDCSQSLCPCERRDATIAMMDNVGSNNGRLLVFGGMGSSTPFSTSPALEYLERRTSNSLLALNDLWYIDLNPLTELCVRDGYCYQPLTWVKVDVPGVSPTGRWGMGMVLDATDNLYITGGASFSSGGGFFELDDLYKFQLRDPFYKKCSATGSGLTTAVAGVQAEFLLQCLDSFEEPADNARFSIEIAGPVDLSPSPVPLGDGKYRCSFTPVVASRDYTITIKVGRGGSVFQDLIGGYDEDPTDSRHAYVGYYLDVAGPSANQNPFSLVVFPGTTDPQVSLAVGAYLSLSTAGSVGTFVVTARDAFANRRPGGDSVISLITLWDVINDVAQNPSQTPNTATVTDNSDGSYSASYAITRGGTYQLTISLANVIGAGTPIFLDVKTDVAKPEDTYAFGALLSVASGKTSTIFVQTRDKYGNFIRAHPDVFPEGDQEIAFELCFSVVDAGLAVDPANRVACGGGEEDRNVGLVIDYSKAPDGTSVNASTNEPYFGLYRIEFFPYNSGSFQPLVLHNGLYISCYFDVSADPGSGPADACLASVAEASLSSRRSARIYTREEVLAHHEAVSRGAASRSPLRRTHQRRLMQTAVTALDNSNRQMQIQQSFVPPDTGRATYWVFIAPVACACIGGGVVICTELYDQWAAKKKRQEEEEKELLWQASAVAKRASGVDLQEQEAEQHPPAQPSAPRTREQQYLEQLQTEGLLTPEEVEACEARLAEGDPRILGLMDSHERSMLRAAEEVKAFAQQPEGALRAADAHPLLQKRVVISDGPRTMQF